MARIDSPSQIKNQSPNTICNSDSVTGDVTPMRRIRKTSLIALLLVSSSVLFSHFSAPQSRRAPQGAPRQPEQASEKAPTSEQKQPDYSQEAYVLEQMKTSYRFEKDGTGLREQSIRVKVQSDAGVE